MVRVGALHVCSKRLPGTVCEDLCLPRRAGRPVPTRYLHTRLLLHLVQILVERINELCLPHQCECHVTCHVEFHFIFIAFPVPEYADDIIPSQKSCEAKLVKKLHVDKDRSSQSTGTVGRQE